MTAPARSSPGQSTAELAILLPVLVLLVLLVIQVGVIARDYVVVQHAAREGARAAGLAPRLSSARDGAAAASSLLDPTDLSVTLSGDRNAGGIVTVGVTYRSSTRVPLVGLLVGDVELTSRAAARVE